MVLPEEKNSFGKLETSPKAVLSVLAGLLGRAEPAIRNEKEESEKEWSNIPWEDCSVAQNANDDESFDCDFSSFPSLSLERKGKAEEQAKSCLRNRKDVETHCAFLLSRPVLVSNVATKSCGVDEDEDEDAFMATSVTQIPQIMLQNVAAAFATLIQSRLRAHATFLARHSLSVAACFESAQEVEEGIAASEQKLETLVGLGGLVRTSSISISLEAQPGAIQCESEGDGDSLKATMPVDFAASLSVMIPTVQGEAEEVILCLVTFGSITGIFSKATESACLLRVIELDLNTTNLLACMKERAVTVVSKIVEVTNAAYSVWSPELGLEGFAAAGTEQKAPPTGKPWKERKRLHVIEDDNEESLLHTPGAASHQPDEVLQDGLSTLSRDRCVKILDFLFNGMDERALNQSHKRARLSSPDDCHRSSVSTPN